MTNKTINISINQLLIISKLGILCLIFDDGGDRHQQKVRFGHFGHGIGHGVTKEREKFAYGTGMDNI